MLGKIDMTREIQHDDVFSWLIIKGKTALGRGSMSFIMVNVAISRCRNISMSQYLVLVLTNAWVTDITYIYTLTA